MPLTDTLIRTLKAGPRTRKVADARGLYLEVTPAGHRWWRFKYRFQKKEKRMSLGVYPEVSLKEARAGCDAARALLRKGIDPSAERKQRNLAAEARSTNSVEIVAREWYAKRSVNWAASSTRVLRRLEMYVFPHLGSRPVAEVTAPELLAVLRRVESRTVETAHRTLRECGQVFRYAIATGRCERDVSADLRGALPAFRGGNFAATLEPARLRTILQAMHAYTGSRTVGAAMRLMPLVFVRPGELRQALWSEVDLDKAEWRYLVTKTRTEHLVPLATQAVAILREQQTLSGRSPFVFPSLRNAKKPMSDMAVLAAMRSLGIGKEEMSGHGFRAVARTWLDEELGFRPDIIEHQLAHAVRDPNGRAYNRTSHLPERRRMMQVWADHLEELRLNDKNVKHE